MDFNRLVDFLVDLQANNNKAWMDENRKRYKTVRTDFIHWLDHLDQLLLSLDPDYYPTPGKAGINRINNNLMFHPHKPVYKDHFGAGLDKAPGKGDFYLEIGISESLFAGGIWRPEAKTLKSIREAIDYNGEELKRIMAKKSFKQMFGDLYEDEKLRSAPKGYSRDHPHIDLLKNKSFGVVHRFPTEQVYKSNFEKKLLSAYWEMKPFRDYLNEAITV